MKYNWYVNNLNESNIIKDANESVLKLNSSDNIAAIEAIYCIVHNSIKYSNDKHEKESITVFYLNPLKTSTSSADLTTTTNSSLSHFSKIIF
jgi:tetrahydromethanopterin S-methyltransferase subunit H